jgi:hypothetical protein
MTVPRLFTTSSYLIQAGEDVEVALHDYYGIPPYWE